MLKNIKSAITTVANELYILARQAGGEALGKAAVEKARETIFTDKRAELMSDLLLMEDEDKDNLLKWHRNAIESHTENRLVTLLCKIPKENRQDILKRLNRLDDKEFQEKLYMLEHDLLQQFLARMLGHTKDALKNLKENWPKVEESANAAAVEVEKINKELEEVLAKVTAWADSKKKGT